MQEETKKALVNFIDAVEELTAGCLLHIGMETASKVLDACEKLKLELRNE